MRQGPPRKKYVEKRPPDKQQPDPKEEQPPQTKLNDNYNQSDQTRQPIQQSKYKPKDSSAHYTQDNNRPDHKNYQKRAPYDIDQSKDHQPQDKDFYRGQVRENYRQNAKYTQPAISQTASKPNSHNNRQPYQDSNRSRHAYPQKGNSQQYKKKQYPNDASLPLNQRHSSTTGDFNCLICGEDVKKRDQIWSCTRCIVAVHLRCICNWITKVNDQHNQPAKKTRLLYQWECLQCKLPYVEAMPKYYCYCGKFQNPQYEEGLEPHTCGRVCGKRHHPNCPAPCTLLCHSGLCPPCKFEGLPTLCECGKSQRKLKCCEEKTSFICGKKCEKPLACGKHKCERNCHYGDCFPCKRKKLTTCYCGNSQDVMDCQVSSYCCYLVCGKQLACQFHTCEEPCHPGECSSCRKTPQLVRTCPCGQYDLELLVGDENQRKTCSDPIPVCWGECRKNLRCGHKCTKSCHQGRCAECKVKVEQRCACGQTSRLVQCCFAESEAGKFKCDSVCLKKKKCGIHKCKEVCCPLRRHDAQRDHVCDLLCGKDLNCGKHKCEEPCHLGPCKKCPVIYSQAQPCPCEATSLKPPVFCGTLVPECDGPCKKAMECGHKCTMVCHYGKCRCAERISIKCRCGRESIETVCGREALCLNKCQLVMQCGHVCGKQCHTGECGGGQACSRTCNKERTDCKHRCQLACHQKQGVKCEDESCQVEVLQKCPCGNRQRVVVCQDVQDELECSNKCANHKRFDLIYKNRQIYYSDHLLAYAMNNNRELERIEVQLADYVLKSDQSVLSLESKNMENRVRIALLALFENHYHLSAQYSNIRQHSSFTITLTPHSLVPKPILSEYAKQVTKGVIKRSSLPFAYTVSIKDITKMKQVSDLMKNYAHHCYVERKDKYVLVHFWSANVGLEAQKILEANCGPVWGKTNEIEDQLIGVTSTGVKDEFGATSSDIYSDNQSDSSNEHTAEDNRKPPEQKTVTNSQHAFQLIFKPTPLNFVQPEFESADKYVDWIYDLDGDQLDQKEMNWTQYISDLADVSLPLQACQWRVRALIILSSFTTIYDHTLIIRLLKAMVPIYRKHKLRTAYQLTLRRIEAKEIQNEMHKDGVYLSDFEPEFMSYLRFFKYLQGEDWEENPLQLDSCFQNMHEFMHISKIIEAHKEGNNNFIGKAFLSSDYVMACLLCPLIVQLRELVAKELLSGSPIEENNLHIGLGYSSYNAFAQHFLKNGLSIQKILGKRQEDRISLKSGKIVATPDWNSDLLIWLKEKRHIRHLSEEPKDVVDKEYATRSYFAFGDHRVPVNGAYVRLLVRVIKEYRSEPS